MTKEEFSNQFDIQINAYANQSLGGLSQSPLEFDEYEKSVLLTEAQNDLIINLYNGNNSFFRESYEETEQLRKYLTDLVVSWENNSLTENSDKPPYSSNNDNEVYYRIELPEEALFITWEGVMIDNKFRDVVPVKYDEWLRISRNPFRQPNEKWRALRLDTGTSTIEIISAAQCSSYHVRYIKKPKPIILTELGELTIESEHAPRECELNPVLHTYILNIAIQKALASRATNSKPNV